MHWEPDANNKKVQLKNNQQITHTNENPPVIAEQVINFSFLLLSYGSPSFHWGQVQTAQPRDWTQN